MLHSVLCEMAMGPSTNLNLQSILLRLLGSFLVLVAAGQVLAWLPDGEEGTLPLIELARGSAHPDITGTGGTGDYFGFALDIEGTRMLVSAPGEQYEPYGPGVVYSFVRSGDDWRKEARLVAEGVGSLGYALALDGDTALLGSINSSVEVGGTNLWSAGHAVVYERSGTNWNEQARLQGDRDYAQLGVSVALLGDVAHVGVPGQDDAPGEVRQYVRIGTNWTWQSTLQSESPTIGDRYGRSIARTTSRLAVVARGENRVHIYAGGGTNWLREAVLAPGLPVEGVELSRIAWVDDDHLLVSAPADGYAAPGEVDRLYVFARIGTNWVEQAALTDAASTDPDDSFGWGAMMHEGILITGGKNVAHGAFVQEYAWSGSGWIEGNRRVVGSSIVSHVGHYEDEVLVGMPRHEARGAVRRWSVSGTNWTQRTDLELGDGGDGHYFGFAVSMDGERTLVGAPGAVPPCVYVFRKDITNWVREAKWEGRSRWPPTFGWGLAVALSGDTALVGDSDFDESEGAFPHAVVYGRNGSIWSVQAELSAAVPGTYDRFGWSVALDGDTALVGAPEMAHPTEGHADWGGARIFHRSGTNWTLQADLVPESPYGEREFGSAVSLSGDRAVIGLSNGALVYERSDTNWVLGAILEPIWSDWKYFGRAVAVEGDRAVVGSPGTTVEGFAEAGSVSVFFRDATNGWVREARLVAPDPGEDAAFGASVALCGDRLVVGAPGYNDSSATGHAYLFQRRHNNWVPREIDVDGLPEHAWLGISTAISGTNLVVGSAMESGEALSAEFSMEQGRVRFWELVEPWGQWVEIQGLVPDLTDGPLDDPDLDDGVNLYEYATGSIATNPASLHPIVIDSAPSGSVVRFTRNPDAIDATLVLERSIDLTETGAWVGVATNIWGQWMGEIPVEDSTGAPRNVELHIEESDPAHAAYRLQVKPYGP